jgi:hypothetical protein
LTLAMIQMPTKSIIRTLISSSSSTTCSSSAIPNNRIYAGSSTGSIYIIDFDDYSMNQTLKQSIGSTIVVHHNNNTSQSSSQQIQQKMVLNEAIEDIVFGSSLTSSSSLGGDKNRQNNTSYMEDDMTIQRQQQQPYQIELRGHDRSITSLAELIGDEHLLISGDDCGTIRIWDLQSRCCIRTVRPWSHSNNSTNDNLNSTTNGSSSSSTTQATKLSASSNHPVTSIRLLCIDNENENNSASISMFGAADSSHNHKRHTNISSTSITSLLTPFQRYVAFGLENNATSPPVLVPFLKPKRSDDGDMFWDVTRNSFPFEGVLRRKRLRRHHSSIQSISASNMTQETDKIVDNKEAITPTTETNQSGVMIRSEKNQINTNSVDENNDDESSTKNDIEKLKKELEDAKSTIERWENVNNKLLERLQQLPQKSM